MPARKLKFIQKHMGHTKATPKSQKHNYQHGTGRAPVEKLAAIPEVKLCVQMEFNIEICDTDTNCKLHSCEVW